MSVVIPVARGLNTNDFPGKLNSWFRSLSPTGLKHCAALANCFNLLNLLNTRLPQISTVLNALWLRRQVQQLQPLVRPLKNGKNCSEGTLQLQRMPKGSHTHEIAEAFMNKCRKKIAKYKMQTCTSASCMCTRKQKTRLTCWFATPGRLNVFGVHTSKPPSLRWQTGTETPKIAHID